MVARLTPRVHLRKSKQQQHAAWIAVASSAVPCSAAPPETRTWRRSLQPSSLKQAQRQLGWPLTILTYSLRGYSPSSHHTVPPAAAVHVCQVSASRHMHAQQGRLCAEHKVRPTFSIRPFAVAVGPLGNVVLLLCLHQQHQDENRSLIIAQNDTAAFHGHRCCVARCKC